MAPWFCAALVISLLLGYRLRATDRLQSGPIDRRSSALPVHTMTVRSQVLEESVTATGTVRAEESIDVQPEVAGKLVKICFEEGTSVRAGELLALINDSELRATLQRATHRRELARLKVRRLTTLVEKGGVPQQDHDIATSELNVFEAEVTLIEAQLARTEIRAPFDGVVGLRHVSEGAYVTPGTRIATFQRMDRLKVDFNIPEKYAHRIGLGGEVSIMAAGSAQPLIGKVHAIEPLVDAATRTVQVRAVCANPSGRLFSGGFARVRLSLPRIPDAILVPSLALVPGASEQSVYVVENGRASRRVVLTGTRTDTAVQIVAGLRPSELVIISNLQQIRPGLEVRAVPDGVRTISAAAAAGPEGESPVATTALN